MEEKKIKNLIQETIGLDDSLLRAFIEALFGALSKKERSREQMAQNHQLDGKSLYAGHEEDPSGGGLYVHTILWNQSKDVAFSHKNCATGQAQSKNKAA